MTHELKTWTQYFDAVECGDKTFEIRQNDRDYQIGDTLHLRCYDPATKTYDGRELRRRVTYIIEGELTWRDVECAILGMVPL